MTVATPIKKPFVPKPPEPPEVIEARWKKKKERLQHLSNSIRKLRVNISHYLKDDDEKLFLTALVIAIMDKTGERVGNDASASSGHFGITGLTKKHINIIGNKVLLNYTGKSGVEHDKSFSDERIAKSLKRACKNSHSHYVFETSDGFRIKNDKVNRYLEEFGISAKDIRGHCCNRFMVDKLNKITPEETDKKRKKQFNKLLKQVADKIGHGKGTLKKHYLVPELPTEFIEHGKVVDIKDFGYAMENGGKIETSIKYQESGQKTKSAQEESSPLVVFQKHYAKHGALFGGSYF